MNSFKFSDSYSNRLIEIRVIQEGKVEITQETFLTRKTIILYLEDDKIKVKVNSFWFLFWRTVLRRAKVVRVEDLLEKGHSVYFTQYIGLLKDVLECNSTEKLTEKINDNIISEMFLMGIIENLFNKIRALLL